jgi:hypothetical protein
MDGQWGKRKKEETWKGGENTRGLFLGEDTDTKCSLEFVLHTCMAVANPACHSIPSAPR